MMPLISKNIHWILRLPIAITFFVHGIPKLGNEVANLGYIGYLVGPFEFLGAGCLLIGPFYKDSITRIGSLMISIIMVGAIYLHLFKWGDSLKDIEWQFLILAVSIFFIIKGNNE